MSENGSHASKVADHYNKKDVTDLAVRSQSRIFYLRNFNNWIKSVLINEYMNIIRNENKVNRPSVLDLGCGRGGDILKWSKANVSRVTFVDIAEKSLEECKVRFNNKTSFEAEFLHLDATKELIKDKIENNKHDLVSSQFVLHYSFESFEQADMFMKNVSESLKPGGYFIGTTTNANELIKRIRESDTNCFGNEIYKIKFYQEDKQKFDLFGVKFDFQLENVVECPEFLVNFDALIRIAQRHNLEFVFKKTFDEFFDDHCQNYKDLISVMQALEPYYPKDLADDDSNRIEGDYEYIESKLKDENFRKDLTQNETYATLSKSEWEAITLYLVFAFKKVENFQDKDDNKQTPKTDVSTSKKRNSSESSFDSDGCETVTKKKL